MGFLEDALLVGGGVTFAQHEHNKHAMQRMSLNSQLNGGQQQGGAGGAYSQSRGLGYSMAPSYSQGQGYGLGNAYGSYGGQDMITVSRSEWDRLQNDAAEGRRQMQKYTDKIEELDRERREMRKSA